MGWLDPKACRSPSRLRLDYERARDVVGTEAMIEETDVPGERTIALKVQDHSMEP
jgi:hypothetical protein